MSGRYNPRDLSVLAYANGFTLWHYTTNDATVLTNGYFNEAFEMLRRGDILMCNVADFTRSEVVSVKNVDFTGNRVKVVVTPISIGIDKPLLVPETEEDGPVYLQGKEF